MRETLPEGTEAVPDTGRRFDHQPLGRLYVFLTLSLGVYTLWWFARAGRASRALLGRGPAPALWVVGSLIPIVGSIALYRLGERARECAERHGGRPFSGHLPAAALYLLMPIVQTVSPPWVMFATVLVAPASLLLVQRQMNAAWARETTTAAPLRWRWVLVGAGVVAWGLLGSWAWTEIRVRWAADRVPAGTVIEGAAAAYALSMPRPDWVRLPVGLFSDPSLDLEIRSLDGESWAAARVYETEGRDFDELVDERASVIEETMKITSFEESRAFCSQLSLAPVSIASYEVAPVIGRGTFVVGTLELDDAFVEVIGFASAGAGDLEGVRSLVASLCGRMAEAP